MKITKAYGISAGRMQQAIDCINRLAACSKTGVVEIEVIEKYNNDNLATWQVYYRFSNSETGTLMINKKAIY